MNIEKKIELEVFFHVCCVLCIINFTFTVSMCLYFKYEKTTISVYTTFFEVNIRFVYRLCRDSHV